MKEFFKKIIIKILTWEARLVIRKYKPKLIGITGSIGKTSTKEDLAKLLATKYHIRKSAKSYNSEFGVPLTILNCRSAWNNPLGWLANIWAGLALIIFDDHYPEWLVLEVGADRPGDIKNLAKWLTFDIAVVTALPDVPVHIEFFNTKEKVIEEKLALIKALGKNGIAVVNLDDNNLRGELAGIKAKTVTYGFGPEADFRAGDISFMAKDETGFPAGMHFDLVHKGKVLPIEVPNILGQHLLYPILAASAVASLLKVGPKAIAKELSKNKTFPGRFNPLSGIKDTLILDDTYNSSPAALEAALLALGKISAKRRIAVIGDMLELGPHTIDAHRTIGKIASEICNIIITIGPRAKFVREAAEENKFSPESIFSFDDARQAGASLQSLIKPGDAILVKGSQSMRMERVVEEIMLHPEDKEFVLVRQEKEWLNK